MPLTQSKCSSLKMRASALLVSSLMLGACNSTHAPAPVVNVNDLTNDSITRISERCATQVTAQQTALENASLAQYLSLASSAEQCIEGMSFDRKHPDIQQAMQFNALAFTNYVKAGDLAQAENALKQFKQRFPQQDLLFADYTSFIDTATVLLQHQQLSQHQLLALNISPALREEMQRKRTWQSR